MAKINARGARQVGPTLFTERTRRPSWDGDVPTVYVEAWRQRSDGMIQRRIVRTRPAEGHEGCETEHSSGFTNLGVVKDSAEHESPNLTWLRSFLELKGATITKERG